MNRWIGLCFLTILCPVPAMAIDALVSHTIFYQPDAKLSSKLLPHVEVYWQIKPNTLHYITNQEKKIVANVKTDIIFMNDAGLIKHDRYILQTVPRANVNELMQQRIIELRRYELPAGLVKMKLVLTDMADSFNHFSFSDSFRVSPASNNPFYSGIELLDSVFESPVETAFKKNGKQQVPLCTNFLDDGVNTIRYYAELYGADHISGSDYPLVQKVAISKNENEGFYSGFLKTDTITTQKPLLFISGDFHTASLPSGNYYLRITLENKAHTNIAFGSLFFQRLNKHPIRDTTKKSDPLADTGIEHVTVLNLNKTFLAKYSLAQLRAILKMLLPFSNQQETMTINGFLKKPDEMYMRYYIYNYFAAINKDDPGRAWKEFSVKITEVNKLYNTSGTPGYETERGFIYLRYGPPTDIITVENEQGSLPYEIWQYNTLTQMNHKEVPDALFLFYRPNQMIADFKLLHSTVTGEVQNADWRTILYAIQGQVDNSNSRAEQYIGNR